MDRLKSRGGKSQRRESEKEEDQRRERVRRKKMQVREKVVKSPNTAFLNWFVAPEGRKVTSLKRRVRSHLGRWEMKKLHAVVARSTFPSQNVQSTPFSDHFWRLRCWKSERHCGAKHMSKSKCTKHTILGPLLEVTMSKKCAQLWREAHFQVKSVKNWWVRTTISSWAVEKVHGVMARSTCPSQNVQSTPHSAHFWKLRGWKSAGRYAVVGRSTFPSQKCQKLKVSSFFSRSDVEKVHTN